MSTNYLQQLNHWSFYGAFGLFAAAYGSMYLPFLPGLFTPVAFILSILCLLVFLLRILGYLAATLPKAIGLPILGVAWLSLGLLALAKFPYLGWLVFIPAAFHIRLVMLPSVLEYEAKHGSRNCVHCGCSQHVSKQSTISCHDCGKVLWRK